MDDQMQRGWQTYLCATCRGKFTVQKSETPVCCPLCRMNRVRRTD